MAHDVVRGDISTKCGQFCSIEWKIKKFLSKTAEVGEEWQSPRFHFAGATWYISLYPKGHKIPQSSEGWVSIYIKQEEPDSYIPGVFFILGLKAIRDDYFRYKYLTDEDGIPFLEKRSEINKNKDYFIDEEGMITFFCTVHRYSKDMVSTAVQTSTFEDFSYLSRDLKKLFVNETGTDVTIKVKDRQFRVHLLILEARSPTFAGMLKCTMKEKNTDVVELLDLKAENLREFLIYLYTGQAEVSLDNMFFLYSTACKYNVKQLKTRCSDFMMEEMSEDSFHDILSLAIRYDDKTLNDCASDFFLKNVKKITGTVKWTIFTEKYPMQSNELIAKIVNEFVK